jgi:hypothetical protein
MANAAAAVVGWELRRGHPGQQDAVNHPGQQSVVQVRRRTEAGEAPRWPINPPYSSASPVRSAKVSTCPSGSVTANSRMP